MMKYFEKHRVARCNCLTPGQISTLMALGVQLPSSLKVMISAGEGLPMATARQWCERYPHVELLSNYACTETASDIAMLKITEQILRIDMLYAPLTDDRLSWNNKFLIQDEELIIQGWNIASGYLPPAKSNAFSSSSDGISNVYHTGDRVQMRDGYLFIMGRVDKVVKVRGFRVDLDGLEAILAKCPYVTDSAVAKHNDNLYCIILTPDLPAVQAFAQENYAHASLIVWLHVDSIPLTKSGKKDRAAIRKRLEQQTLREQSTEQAEQASVTPEEERVAEAVKEVLGRSIDRNTSFTQAGGHSLAAMRIAKILEISAQMLFAFPTIALLAKALAEKAGDRPSLRPPAGMKASSSSGPLAVTSMACRVPGAEHPAEFWAKLQEGALMTTKLPCKIWQIPRKGVVPDHGFDCQFWNTTPAAAALLDTSQRAILEVAYEALQALGTPVISGGRLQGLELRSKEVGVAVCGGSLNHWTEQLGINLEHCRTQRPDEYFNLEVGTDKDYLATSIAYRFDLAGPAEVVQTACSSALVAIRRGVQMVRAGDCESVVSGGASFSPDAPIKYVDGLIWARDGVCRPYAEGANGTTNADGAGVVVLSLLDAAKVAEHPILANVLGAAVNNDGSRKAHFSAPSYQGQVECVSRAHADAALQEGWQLDYVEGHGTGTKIGDPLEIHALTQVLEQEPRVYLGSVKGNVGHLNTAAGVPGFIKAVMMLNRQMLVPSLFADTPTKEVDWGRTPLLLASEAMKFDCRLTGVSSFGVGGTNAHVVLGRGGETQQLPPAMEWVRTPVRELLAAAPASAPAAPVTAMGTSRERTLEEWFYEESREQVRLSPARLTSAAVLLDGQSMPEGLPGCIIPTTWSRAMKAAAAAGRAFIFVGSSTEEPGVEDTTQEDLLLHCMAFLKRLARGAHGLQIFFVLQDSVRYAGLLGLLRSASKEHPELKLRILRREGAANVLLPAVAGEFLCTDTGTFAPRLQRCTAPLPLDDAPRARCTLVTGGLRGLGLAVAQRLAATKRTESLILIGRRAPQGAAADRVRELSGLLPVEVICCDVASWQEVSKLPDQCDLVIHCAGAVKDGVIINLTDADALKVLRPKIRGAIHLRSKYPHAKKMAFSSSSGLFGVPGQSTYAAGNTFVDAVMPSIQWGGWGETGMVEDHGIKPLPGERFFTVERGREWFKAIKARAPDQKAERAFKPDSEGRERALALPFEHKGKVAALRASTNPVLPGDIGGNGVLPCQVDQPQGGDLVKHAGENNMATGAGLEMQVDHQGNSPTKRRAPDKQEDMALNIDIIREAIRGELKDALSDVKQDLRTFATRVDNVESQVTRKMQQTINLLDDMTAKYAAHGDMLQQLQEANREVNLRLERLEKGGGASSVAGSTTASDNSRRPALIIGGWDPDQDAATTKEAAGDVLKTVGAPIDLGPLFVPGVRRGYAILPIDEPMGETFEQRKQRIQEVIAKVRDANVQLGRRPDGGTRRVWIAMSQPPDRRRRARLAAKVKRLYLTLGGDKNALQMEFSTGTAWINGVKVSSATAPKPGGTEDAGPGWINLSEIAKATRTAPDAASTAWSPLKAEIN
ncbi:pksJ [Symbiodinium sp. CCMP2592]|nr:pksJ [Symbiodinium sp. CCMP2592]